MASAQPSAAHAQGIASAPAERAERGAQARLAALEAVVQDTEAELARLRQSKAVNHMVRMYQGARAQEFPLFNCIEHAGRTLTAASSPAASQPPAL
jgi:hypothetical protein